MLTSGAVAGFGAMAKECIEKRRFVPVPGAIGLYQRVHPSGKYTMASINGQVIIFDLTTNPARAIKTSMNDETYPVEGSWDLLASPNHDDEGMNYFSFDEVLRDGRKAQAKFNDPEHNEYYHSAAEFPDSTKEKRHFRTALYTKLRYRDYTMTPASLGRPAVQKSEIKSLCEQIVDERPRDPVKDEALRSQLRTLEKTRKDSLKIIERHQTMSINAANSRRRNELRTRLLKAKVSFNEDERKIIDAQRQLGLVDTTNEDLSEPTLSKDAELIGTVTRSPGELRKTLQILKIEGSKCTRVADLGYATGKASFSYPEKNVSLKLTFTGERLESEALSQTPARFLTDEENKRALKSDKDLRDLIAQRRRPGDQLDKDLRKTIALSMQSKAVAHMYDVGTKKTVRISEIGDSPSSPGFTRDGRIIYAGQSDGRNGFFIVDPNQADGGSGVCITKEDAERAGQNSESPSTTK